jgi:hypothetical protein
MWWTEGLLFFRENISKFMFFLAEGSNWVLGGLLIIYIKGTT